MNYDVAVIGSGMSGLIAAAKAVSQKKNTIVITKGRGVLPLTSGCVDFWGYELDNPKVIALNPYVEISKIASRNPRHPYTKVLDILKESAVFFKDILKLSGCSLSGSIFSNQLVLTALGTERMSCLVPPSMAIPMPAEVKKIIAVGFKNYPDFFPEMFLDNLNNRLFPQAVKKAVIIDLGIKETVRSSHLSFLLESEKVQKEVIKQLQTQFSGYGKDKGSVFNNSTLFVFPAVLGRTLDNETWKKLVNSLQAQVIEVPGLPPSIPGERIYKALTGFLRQKEAEICYNSEVIDFASENGRITSVVMQDSSHTAKIIEVRSAVLATGSFFGGGIVATKNDLREPIFKIPIVRPENQENKGNFLSLKGQEFLAAGIEVDDQLRPCQNIKNLYAVGSILAHSNYAAEKCGLGLAIATGYKAGSLA